MLICLYYTEWLPILHGVFMAYELNYMCTFYLWWFQGSFSIWAAKIQQHVCEVVSRIFKRHGGCCYRSRSFPFSWLNGFKRTEWFYCYHMSRKVCSVVAYHLKFYLFFSSCCYFGIPVIAVNIKSEWFKFSTERTGKNLNHIFECIWLFW